MKKKKKDSQDSKNFMKYVLNSSGQEVLNKYNKNTKVASLKVFYNSIIFSIIHE